MTTAIVTGAGSGLGKTIALRVGKKYDSVVLIGRDSNKLNAVAQQLNGRTFCLACDLTNDQQIKLTANWIQTHLKSVDLLVNNAGLGYFENLLDQDFEQINRTIATDLTGMIKFTRLILPMMVDHVDKVADVVNVASIAGKVATPKTTTYAAAKFGAVGFSNALRLELKDRNVNVHTINPGPMDTDFFNIADPTGNYLKGVQAFVVSPKKVADLVIKAIEQNLREVNVPKVMELGSILYTLLPKLGDYLVNSPLINRK